MQSGAATTSPSEPVSNVLTYAQLDERSNRLAQALRALGVREGSRVAHLDRTGLEVVELLFATSKLGAVIVPLNWRLAPPELRAIVADARARVVLAGEDYAEVAADLTREPELVVLGEAYERLVAAHDPIDPGGRGAPERHRAPDVHVGDDGRPERRADDASQPGRRGGSLDAAGGSTATRSA